MSVYQALQRRICLFSLTSVMISSHDLDFILSIWMINIDPADMPCADRSCLQSQACWWSLEYKQAGRFPTYCPGGMQLTPADDLTSTAGVTVGHPVRMQGCLWESCLFHQ